VINYQLGNKYDGQSTSVLDMDCLPPGVSFQPTLSSDSEDCYLQQSQQIFNLFVVINRLNYMKTRMQWKG
jgi:hypothetical protein